MSVQSECSSKGTIGSKKDSKINEPNNNVSSSLRKRRLIGDEFYSETEQKELDKNITKLSLIEDVSSSNLLESTLNNNSTLDPSLISSKASVINNSINKVPVESLNPTSSSPSSAENIIKHVYSISNDVVLYDYRLCGGNGGNDLSQLESKPLNLYCGKSTEEANEIHDMAAILGQTVKNEPEDLTGARRNPSPTDNNQPQTTNHHHVVLSNSDLSSTANFSPTSSGASAAFGAEDFVSYESGGRGNNLYSTPSSDSTSFRSESEIYNSSVTNFVQRSPGSEVQYVQYNPYKTGSGSSLSSTTQIASPDSGIGESSNFTSQNESFEYPHADMMSNDLSNRKPWHDYGRQSEEKVHIDKLFSPYGFRYTLEAGSSSSVRREDDKITYVNKGQFYGITLEYVGDPDIPPLKSSTVKSVIMVVFREGKGPEEELKSWQFWHARQHSVKQRILDADTKNSSGLVGSIDEIAHNALAIYWNPLECPAKVNIAVQCLSTDFSTQKGVKGLPLHLQIDTFEDDAIYHRGYYQIKVFCDKGAERKARDEERRANKRRLSTNGKRRMEELYHPPAERSEFYSMADLNKTPVLFQPSEEFEMTFPPRNPSPPSPSQLLNKLNVVEDLLEPTHPTPPLCVLPPEKRPKLIPPLCDRIMIYVRQETEEAYTPLHLIPPTVNGLIRAVETKYKINANNIRFIYKKSKGGILAKIDDDMLKYYCNEDVFLMQVMVTEGAAGEEQLVYDITLSEC